VTTSTAVGEQSRSKKEGVWARGAADIDTIVIIDREALPSLIYKHACDLILVYVKESTRDRHAGAGYVIAVYVCYATYILIQKIPVAFSSKQYYTHQKSMLVRLFHAPKSNPRAHVSCLSTPPALCRRDCASYQDSRLRHHRPSHHYLTTPPIPVYLLIMHLRHRLIISVSM
jgi:hypothetical protein